MHLNKGAEGESARVGEGLKEVVQLRVRALRMQIEIASIHALFLVHHTTKDAATLTDS
jgi:hypothetical protein